MKITIFTMNDPLEGKDGGGKRLLKMIDYLSRFADVRVAVPRARWSHPQRDMVLVQIGKVKFFYLSMSSIGRFVNTFVITLERKVKLPHGLLSNMLSLAYYDPKVATFLREISLDNDVLQSEFNWSISIPNRIAKKLRIPHVHTAHDIMTYWYMPENSFVNRMLKAILLSIESHKLSKVNALIFLSKLDYSIAEKVMGLTNVEKWIIPNGADESILRIIRNPAKDEVLFVGSSHFPNVEAAAFILHEIAPKLPNIKFIIIGSVCYDLPKLGDIPTNVKLKGVVSDAELFEMYARATVGIIPLKRGSGMKVKITELLSAGIPTITTIVGSEGLDVINGKEVIIENNMTKFPEWIKKLVNDDEFNRLLSENGRKHVMKLTWDRALETYIHVYNKLRSKYIETYSPS